MAGIRTWSHHGARLLRFPYTIHRPFPMVVRVHIDDSWASRHLPRLPRPTPSRKAPPMLHNPPIVITQRDFGLLRRLAGHPRLAAELKRAVVIDSRCIAPDIVTMNCRVRFEDQNTGERREVTIVFPHDATASTRSISVLTPVGTALLGLTVGQSIVWPFPDGTEHCLRVLKIISQPEANDASNERAPHAKHAASDERST